MRRKIMVALTVVFIAAIVSFLIPAPGSKAQAQQNCPSFRALIEYQLLVPELMLRDTDNWGGYVHGYLGQEFFAGRGSGNDGNTTWHPWVGMGKGGSQFFDFGGGNTLTTYSTQATFPNPPGIFPAGGMYMGTHKIGQGTGTFQYASGNLTIHGPYLVWDLDKELPQGRFDAEITGNICGVQ